MIIQIKNKCEVRKLSYQFEVIIFKNLNFADDVCYA